mmetsp:Transcript_106729/g.189011  ORF Transcript_106729/g.189011 Transcript_106729/m.189011 type:complete len:284 (+) Transcript_106729:74-925(+)
MSAFGPTLLTARDVTAAPAKIPVGDLARAKEQPSRHQNRKGSNSLMMVQFNLAHSHDTDELQGGDGNAYGVDEEHSDKREGPNSSQDKDATLSSSGASCTSSVRVKNTFLHIDDIDLSDTSDVPVRSMSLPNMFCDEAFPEDSAASPCMEGAEDHPQCDGNQASPQEKEAGTHTESEFKQSSPEVIKLSSCIDIVDQSQCESAVLQPARGPMPSAGAEKHNEGQCKPCAWFWKSGCRWGSECQHCHMCPEGEIRRRKKEKLARLKHEAFEARAQVERSVHEFV